MPSLEEMPRADSLHRRVACGIEGRDVEAPEAQEAQHEKTEQEAEAKHTPRPWSGTAATSPYTTSIETSTAQGARLRARQAEFYAGPGSAEFSPKCSVHTYCDPSSGEMPSLTPKALQPLASSLVQREAKMLLAIARLKKEDEQMAPMTGADWEQVVQSLTETATSHSNARMAGFYPPPQYASLI